MESCTAWLHYELLMLVESWLVKERKVQRGRKEVGKCLAGKQIISLPRFNGPQGLFGVEKRCGVVKTHCHLFSCDS